MEGGKRFHAMHAEHFLGNKSTYTYKERERVDLFNL